MAVTNDMTNGIMDRFRSMDVGGAAVLGGHVAASIARNLVSTVLVFGVAFLIGFRPTRRFVDWLAAVGILLAFDPGACRGSPRRSGCWPRSRRRRAGSRSS